MTSLLGELREISRGLHPAMLSHAGLRPALKSLARRAPMPVELVIDVAGRIPEPLEVAAYYVVSEALTNAAKHSGASTAQVTVAVSNDMLHVRVHDDGTGGADAARGSGLIGLRDRIEALAGTMTVDSPPRQGTSIVAEIPLTSPTPTESRPQEPVSARPPSFEPARGQCHETRNGTSVTLVPLVPQSVCPGPARAR